MNTRILLTLEAMLAWTAMVALFAVERSSDESSARTSESFYGDLGAGEAAGAANAITFLLVVVVSSLGLGLIWGVARGCAALRRWHRESRAT